MKSILRRFYLGFTAFILAVTAVAVAPGARAASAVELAAWASDNTYDEVANTSQLTFELRVLGAPLVPAAGLQQGRDTSYFNFLCVDSSSGAIGGSGGSHFGSEQVTSAADDIATYRIQIAGVGEYLGRCRLSSAVLIGQDGSQREYLTEGSLAGLDVPFPMSPLPLPHCGDAAILAARGSGENSQGVNYPGARAIPIGTALHEQHGLSLFAFDEASARANGYTIGVTFPAVDLTLRRMD